MWVKGEKEGNKGGGNKRAKKRFIHPSVVNIFLFLAVKGVKTRK